jgi:hypothetical protein
VTMPVLLLALLATYSLTLLLIFDHVTEPLRAWLRRRGHDLDIKPGRQVTTEHKVDIYGNELLYGRCSCGTHLGTAWDRETMEALHDVHVAQANTGGWRYLIGCPWCASAWIALPVVGSALAWGDGWGWQLPAGVIGLRAATGLLASIAHPPERTD